MQHRTRQSRTTQRTTTQRRATLIGLVSSLLLAAGIAQADTKTFTGNGSATGIWNIAVNWSPNGVPGADTRAVIPAGKTCNIDANAAADSIEVQAIGKSLGVLVIKAGFTLTLDNDTDNVSPTGTDNSHVDGLVRIEGVDAVLAFIDNNHGVSGSGEINGTDNDARIDIEADVKFTNRLADAGKGVTGAMLIKGLTGGTVNGIFRNDGLVYANLSEKVLALGANTVLEDHSTTGLAQWTAAKEAILEFNRNATTLKGDFVLTCGEFAIKAHIRTCGDFEWNLGTLSVNTNKIFAYGSFSTNQGCTNPQNTALSVRDCTSWEVDDASSPYTCGRCGGPD